ncbi:glycosyltransferase family 4 protein [Terrilactibacillus laevilacticus]|uniref:glycosyltransferase family 4 protein n=1 Tax=Terrilactibacillus laevilacticus TaxID=1380157 RepID=UPI0011468A13|nr:glycosyltransferase family 4 protein [Terrilactibacillus laevilacticus]
MNKNNVLILGIGLFDEQPGGANRYMTSFANELSKNGINVTLLCPENNNNNSRNKNNQYNFAIERYTQLNVQNNIFGKIGRALKRNKAIKYKVQEFIKNKKKLCVNSHFALNVWPILKILQNNNIPLITHFHGPWYKESLVEFPNSPVMKIRAKLIKRIEKKVYDNSKKIIVLSESFKKILMEEYGIKEGKIILIPGATIINQEVAEISKNDARIKLGLDIDAYYFLTVRRLVNRMGLKELLNAIKSIDNKKIKFIIGGKGPLKDELIQLSKKCNVEVIFPGFISEDDLPYYYRACNTYILPTMALEGFGLVTIESMGYGTPVIATKVGGSKEILSPISKELLMEPNIESIKEKINNVAENKIIMPDENTLKNIVKNQYSWSNVCNRFKELLRNS